MERHRYVSENRGLKRNTRRSNRRNTLYIRNEKIAMTSYYLALARGHWGIENQLHWHLDVTFMEDLYRA